MLTLKEKILVKRVDDYTLQDYKDYCSRNNIEYNYNNFRVWTINTQEEEIAYFIKEHSPNQVIKVKGLVCVNGNYYSIIPKFLTLQTAIKFMLTPDLCDVEITYNNKYKKYYVNGYHGKDAINLFEFALDHEYD